jgi:hypothetical protein
MKRYFIVLMLAFVSSLASPARGDVYGSLNVRYESYGSQEESSGREEWGALGELDLKLESRGRWWDIYLNPMLRADSLGLAEGSFSEYRGDDRQESYITVKEGYFELMPWWWLSLGAGSRIFWWGVGEEVNPTNFNPSRYLNLIEPELLGIPSYWIRIDIPRGVYLELVGSKSASSQLPWDEENRWRPPELKGMTIVEPLVPDNDQFAGRFGLSGSRGDLSLTYFNGYKDVPAFELASMRVLKPEYFRTEVVGANAVVDLLGWFGLKAEAAYKNQDGGQDDYAQWLVGVDKYLSWERQSLYVILQYVRENVIHEGSNPFQDLDLSRVLKDTFMMKVEYEYGDWKLALRGAYDVEWEGYYIQPKISYTWNDWWETTMGYDCLGGPHESSLFVKYGENERVFLEMMFYL